MGVDRRVLDSVARVIECCERRRTPGPEHPPTETMRGVGTLRRFPCECEQAPHWPPPESRYNTMTLL